ncbi:MAG: tryptophan-rich sensory protein [Anaerolineae bacterium]|nr:tryptophan-rich sensory protein [Anaerolineae bacterium]
MKDIVRQVVNVLATIAVIVVNTLANALPINGQTTGEISDRFDVYFVPAGYVFAIWGLIYIALLAFSIYQALPAQRTNPRLRRVGYLYALSCVANIAWLLFWHYEYFWWTLVAMFALLVLLILIYLRLRTGRLRVPAAETWCIRVPFSIYLGWITVATVANVTSVLDWAGWNGWGIGEAAWAVIMLIVAAVVAVAMSLDRGDVAFVGVISWAFIGIAVKQSDTQLVATTAAILALAVLLTLVVGVPRAQNRMYDATPVRSAAATRERW